MQNPSRAISRGSAVSLSTGPKRLAWLLALACWTGAPHLVWAHEIPARVSVLVLVRPTEEHLQVLVRVPLESMRDLQIPLHEPEYLDFSRVGALLPQAARVWIADYLEFFEDNRPLGAPQIVATRISLPYDRSFVSWDSAVAHVLARDSLDVRLPWRQALMDVLLAYPISAAEARFSVRPALAHLGVRTTTVLRFFPPGRAERAYRFDGNPGLVRLDPGWGHAAASFVKLGFHHILGGIDHLLFLLCLVAPFRRLRPLVVMVTAFTAAHSITLVGSAMGLAPSALWFPPLVETLIAGSIVYMACENMLGPRFHNRWLVAFAFGLIHGFGFSYALGESLQFAGSHLATALLAFNLGVELGQLLVIALAVPLLSFVFARGVPERPAVVLLSAVVAHTAWHWMTERFQQLREYQIAWPRLDAAFLVTVLRLSLALLLLGAVAWLLRNALSRLLAPTSERSSAAGADT